MSTFCLIIPSGCINATLCVINCSVVEHCQRNAEVSRTTLRKVLNEVVMASVLSIRFSPLGSISQIRKGSF